MTTASKELVAARRRLKQINASAFIFTHALGVMEVDGWFGRGQQTHGLSECKVEFAGGITGAPNEGDVCVDGGAVCAGIAIDYAAQRYAQARRWNKNRTFKLAWNHLALFQTLNGRTPTNGLFAGIASWNDHEVTDYEDMKQGFATALKALTAEKAALIRQFPGELSWGNNTVT